MNLEYFDFLDYASNLVINNPIKGKIPFELFDYQETIAQQLLQCNNFITCSSRQMGMTTLMLAFVHWYSHNNPRSSSVYCAHNTDNSVWFKKMFMELNSSEDFPDEHYSVNNRTELTLENGARVFFRSPTPTNFKGWAFDVAMFDNASYYNNMVNYWPQIQPHFSKYVWINSTPRKKTDWFYQMFTSPNPFMKLKITWDMHPQRNEQWYEEQKLLRFGSLYAFMNEIEADFV